MNKTRTKLMGKGIVGLVAVAALWVCVGSLTAAQDQGIRKKKVGLSFKVSGGFGYLLDGAGDINKFRQGQRDVLSDLSAEEGYTTSFSWPRPWFLPHFTADIIINVGPHFGFGFGSGYIAGSSTGRYSVNDQSSRTNWGYDFRSESKVGYTPDYRITAVPLKFDFYVFQPLGKADKLTLFARAGAGYYRGRVKFDLRYAGTSERAMNYSSGTYRSVSDYRIDLAGDAKCDTWGYQGGLGLELRLSRAISFSAEVCGRYVNFKDWEGDLLLTGDEAYKYETPYSNYEDTLTVNEKWHGSFWTYQVHDDGTKKNYTYMMLYEKKPNGEYFEDLRKSAINLNALSLAISVKVHFDLF